MRGNAGGAWAALLTWLSSPTISQVPPAHWTALGIWKPEALSGVSVYPPPPGVCARVG